MIRGHGDVFQRSWRSMNALVLVYSQWYLADNDIIRDLDTEKFHLGYGNKLLVKSKFVGVLDQKIAAIALVKQDMFFEYYRVAVENFQENSFHVGCGSTLP